MRQFVPVAFLAVLSLVGLVTLPVPEQPKTLVTLTGSMGSKSDFFNDERVRELLLQHNMQVNVIREGSCDGARGDLELFDFLFPSGQPCADLIVERRQAEGKYNSRHRPFVSPIVLATYRDYAETLRAAGVATPQVNPGFDQPSYYTLDMGRFLDLVRTGQSWADLNGPTNVNRVIAQTPDLCTTNTAATYVGLVSFIDNGRAPSNEEEATDFATKIEPLIDRSLPLPAPEIYFVPEGRQVAPIIVLYEHQYLAYHVSHRERHPARSYRC